MADRPPLEPPEWLDEGPSGEPSAAAPADPPTRVLRARPQEPRRHPPLGGETARRVYWALPWVVFAVAVVAAGGWIFALAMVALALVGLREFFLMTREARPLAPAALITAAAMILAARHWGDAFHVVLVASAGFVVLFGFALERRRRAGITLSMAVTVFGVVWIGVPLVHAVLLRDLPLHGDGLLIDVLVGTFAADTAAYGAGRLFGSHRITPRISPNKTLEGLIGGFLGGTLAFWFAGLYQDWLSGVDALIMGACVAAIAPLGDLFESMVKRDLAVKDTGTIFGPHGGLLDRLDAVLFTVVVGYYLSLALVY